MNDIRTRLAMIVRNLAAPAEAQIAYLRGLGVAPSADELALELADEMALVPAAVEASELSSEEVEALVQLDDMLGRMSGESNAALWKVDALRHADEWRDVRMLARHALSLLEGHCHLQGNSQRVGRERDD